MHKKLLRKDKTRRKQYRRFEIWNKLNKSLQKSLKIYKVSELYSIQGIKIYSKTPIRNYCFKTGRSLGVVPFFKLSRMLVREQSGIGMLVGVYKK